MTATRVVEFRAALVAHALGPDADPLSCPKWIPKRVWYLALELKALSEVLDALEQNPKRDLNRVVDEFLFWLLSEELKDYKTSKPVAELYQRRLAGDEPSEKEWAEAAEAEAAAAAEAAAWAAEAAAARAAAARAARAAAARAVEAAAARAVEAAAARAACRQRMQEKFVSLLGASS